jgi:4-azaleucine resistance transporter AzlC
VPATGAGDDPEARPREVRDGLRAIAPLVVSVIPIGIVVGALATAKGLSVAEACLMSVLAFAGGAQFAAIAIWAHPVPVLAIVFSTLLINSRHLLMSASLTPKMAGFSRVRQLIALYFLVDETWALAEARAVSRPVTPGYWLGLAAPMFVAWVGATLLGAFLGSFMGDPARFGADFAFTAVFIGLTATFWKGPRSAFTIAASLATSALVYRLVGSPWHVAAGALAGIAAAWLAADPDDTEEEII